MTIERNNIGFFGKMNSGKSSLMNLITQQETSITDSTPGTTADIKIALAEIHGLGPVKLYDTAGLDESGQLGEKKREKVSGAIKECDLIILVIDPATEYFETEKTLINEAREINKQIIVVYNLFKKEDVSIIPKIEKDIPILRFLPSIILSAIDKNFRIPLLDFIIKFFENEKEEVDLLPFIETDEFYILIIPMDEETPKERFLRPQLMAVENITRKWAYPIPYRLDLKKARGNVENQERERFEKFINSFSKKPKAVITDSQAIDIMFDWVPDNMILTTFSIMMINYGNRGSIKEFCEGVKVLKNIKAEDKILIAESCNHSRIVEDIGTVQIPAIIKKRFPGTNIDFNFGREFMQNDELSNYKLIIHCGGCMISQQKLQARLRDLRSVGVPITNYGIFLSWFNGKDVLERVVRPWL